MNIAILVPPENPCPPPGYGGTERMAAIWTEKLLQKGMSIDLFCGPGSTQRATHTFVASNNSMAAQNNYLQEIMRLGSVNYACDCMVDLTPHHVASKLTEDCPIVSVMGGDPHKKYPHDNIRNKVYVSREFAAFCGRPDNPVLHNVIHLDPISVPIGEGKGGYCLYVGVVRREKSVHLAAKAADKAGMPLKVYGPVRDLDYWDEIRDHVEYMGTLGAEGRWEVFGGAACFLYPVLWCDAGPLGPMEAMLCGTPVVGIANGGIGSDVEDAVGGYLWRKEVLSDEDMAAGLSLAIADSLLLDRTKTRASILPKIDPNLIIDRLLELCFKAASGEKW